MGHVHCSDNFVQMVAVGEVEARPSQTPLGFLLSYKDREPGEAAWLTVMD